MSNPEFKRFAGQSVNNAGYHNFNWDLVGGLLGVVGGLAVLKVSQGILQTLSISEDLTIPSGMYLQTVDSVIEAGTTVTIEAGGLWYVDT